MKNLWVFGCGLLFAMSIVFPLGISQDYPTNFVLFPNENIVYGVRVANPSEKCISFVIEGDDDYGISTVLNKEAVYYIPPNSTQKIFISITAPSNSIGKSYIVKYIFRETGGEDTQAMIDISMSAQANIRVDIGNPENARNGDPPQNHTITEINGVAPYPKCEIKTPSQQKETGFAEKMAITGESLLTNNQSKMNDIIVPSIMEEKNDDDLYLFAGGLGAIVVSGILVFSQMKKHNTAVEMKNMNENKEVNTP